MCGKEVFVRCYRVMILMFVKMKLMARNDVLFPPTYILVSETLFLKGKVITSQVTGLVA